MIVTFYSYKGGVGRSMALANIDRWFQLQGLSPFISVTTDPEVAAQFAGENGTVYQLSLDPGRAILNPYGLPGESEWLVPNYISPEKLSGPFHRRAR
jgi:hypothetical protein